jgi:hypothetical protein
LEARKRNEKAANINFGDKIEPRKGTFSYRRLRLINVINFSFDNLDYNPNELVRIDRIGRIISLSN